MSAIAKRTGLALLSTAALAVLLALDRWYAISASWHVVGLIAAVSCVASWILLGRRSIGPRLTAMGLCFVGAVGVRYLDWDSRKPFLRDLLSIRQGMTRVDVERVMGRYLRVQGRDTGHNVRAPLGVDVARSHSLPGGNPDRSADSLAYRHTNEGWGDSDVGVVRLLNGDVIAVEFLPD